jgi:serine/threonine-protein kinase
MSPASPASTASRLLPRATAEAAASFSSKRSDFDLVAMSGRGSFAEVWQVRKHPTGEIYALKQLRADRLDQPAARRILENEAEVGCKVSSEHVVKVCEVFTDSAPPFLLLEWLSGQTLEACLTYRKKLFCREALWIARQCAQGMHGLLVAGYTHGDIKPSNIFICDDGTVKLIDLGFARPDHRSAIDLADPAGLMLAGTPEYLAPEVLIPRNSEGIARDIYALGITMYRMLTGALPFQGAAIADVLRQHQQTLPVPLRELAPEVPREVAQLVHRLLSKEPFRRGDGLSWLIRDLIGQELEVLGSHLYRNRAICQNSRV